MSYEMRNGDVLTELPKLIEQGVRVSLVNADIPYFKVKADEWDRQWKNEGEFLAWVGEVCGLVSQVMAPNGSLYLYASPQMAARVECAARAHFNVLNCIRWEKSFDNADRRHAAQLVEKGLSRSYYPSGERIIFAERYGADGEAKGEGEAFIFEPLLRYIAEQFAASQLTRREVDAYFGTANVSQYWLQERNFIIPTADKWAGLQALRPGYFTRPYASIGGEYEGLQEEYARLRRPFSVSADVPYTDVWDFPAVLDYPGKHPCEKPYAMMEHIVRASSRKSDLVLDLCAGSGVFSEAATANGRDVIAIEKDEHWARKAADRAARVKGRRVDIPLPNRRQLGAPLFEGVQ